MSSGYVTFYFIPGLRRVSALSFIGRLGGLFASSAPNPYVIASFPPSLLPSLFPSTLRLSLPHPSLPSVFFASASLCPLLPSFRLSLPPFLPPSSSQPSPSSFLSSFPSSASDEPPYGVAPVVAPACHASRLVPAAALAPALARPPRPPPPAPARARSPHRDWLRESGSILLAPRLE